VPDGTLVDLEIIIVRLLPLVLLLFCTVALGGCVMKSKYEAKSAEAITLATELANLQAKHDALTIANAEQININSALSQDIERSGNDIRRLESVLSDRSAEAGAAMTEMRTEINRLQSANRELEAAVEAERIARMARVAQLQSTYDELVTNMESEIKRGEVTISELEGKLTVNMVESILFPSGSAEIKKEGQAVLKRVGDIVKEIADKDIQVEGHTDNVPISSRLQDKFASNWELSAARAATVVRFLRDSGIAGERLSAAGFGEFQPVADNKTAEGRTQNRRIQIVLVPKQRQIVKSIDN